MAETLNVFFDFAWPVDALKLPSVATVSYTHLDVYKRQSVTFAEFGCVLLDILVELVKVDVSQYGAEMCIRDRCFRISSTCSR